MPPAQIDGTRIMLIISNIVRDTDTRNLALLESSCRVPVH